MKTKVILSQQMASAIIAAGQEEAQKNNWSVSGLADHFLKRTAEFIETCCGRRGEIKCCIGHSNFLSLYVV